MFQTLHIAGSRKIVDLLPCQLPGITQELELWPGRSWPLPDDPGKSIAKLAIREATEATTEDALLRGQAAKGAAVGAVQQLFSKSIDERRS